MCSAEALHPGSTLPPGLFNHFLLWMLTSLWRAVYLNWQGWKGVTVCIYSRSTSRIRTLRKGNRGQSLPYNTLMTWSPVLRTYCLLWINFRNFQCLVTSLCKGKLIHASFHERSGLGCDWVSPSSPWFPRLTRSSPLLYHSIILGCG